MEPKDTTSALEVSQHHSHLRFSELHADSERRADTVGRLHPRSGETIVLTSIVPPQEFKEEILHRSTRPVSNDLKLVYVDPAPSSASSADAVSRASPLDLTGILIELSKSLDEVGSAGTHIHLFDVGIISQYHGDRELHDFLQHITEASHKANAQLSIYVRPEIVNEEQLILLNSITDTTASA